MAAAARQLTRALLVARPRIALSVRPAVAAMGPRLLSARAPIPEPKWKQQDNLDNKIPTDLDQATGLERAELLAELEGKSLFEEQPIGPFGTEANPVIVESISNERIMGCPGNCDSGDSRSSNEIRGYPTFCCAAPRPLESSDEVMHRWFVVSDKKPYKCGACGQVFALKKIHGAEYAF